MSVEDNLGASNYEPEVSQQFIRVPGERIGALIGKKGAVVEKIKQECRVKIEIESETGNVIVGYNSSLYLKGTHSKRLK